ncbi:MAG: glycosyltransferase family 2 protein [Armatimonadetes bacterium]|nr:glycosyltransferase family 2 protein [Armatimonadota bacterium]
MSSNHTTDVVISVIIPTYNRGAAIHKTIESALQQDLPPDQVEVIVVDDGSTDDTWQILQSAYEDNVRVRLFSIANGGVARARNFGLEQARGEFIAFLDHDDLWFPQKLRKQLEAISEDERIGVVYCNWQLFDKTGILQPHVWQPRFEFGRNGAVEKLLTGNFIISMSVPLIRTQLVRSVDGFDPDMVPCDDWDVWIRLANQSEFVGLRETLVQYHQHEAQQSRDEDAMWAADRRVRWKNWRITLKYPRAIPSLAIPFYMRQTSYSYFTVKTALFEKKWATAWKETLRCLARYPVALFSPQWIYLLLRLLRRDSRPF